MTCHLYHCPTCRREAMSEAEIDMAIEAMQEAINGSPFKHGSAINRQARSAAWPLLRAAMQMRDELKAIESNLKSIARETP